MFRWAVLFGCVAAGIGLAVSLALGPLAQRRREAPPLQPVGERAMPLDSEESQEVASALPPQIEEPPALSLVQAPEILPEEEVAPLAPEPQLAELVLVPLEENEPESPPSSSTTSRRGIETPPPALDEDAYFAGGEDREAARFEVSEEVAAPAGFVAAVQTNAEPDAEKEEDAPPAPPFPPPPDDEPIASANIEEVAPPPAPAVVQSGESNGKLVIDTKDSDIREVLKLLGEAGGYNILASKSVTGQVTASLTNVDVDEALAAILNSTGYISRREGRFIYVGQPADLAQMDQLRDTIGTRVYRPNYVTAAELNKLITPLLTETVGKATVSSPAEVGIANDSARAGGDNFGGAEVVIVRDYLSVLAQIDQIVADVDRRPKQVAIEAMILSVKLDNTNEFGVDLSLLRNAASASLVSGTPAAALANMDFTEGGFKFGFLDGSVGSFIKALETVGETSVVAAPRLMCLNKQRAEILIGAQLGYISTTVTETASTQSVEFLEVGAQLRLRPFISEDGVIRMEVHPELSTGVVKVEDGLTLPDKEVTQVTTNIMCADGRTVIIGGLIREDLSTNINQLPYLGSLPYVGWAFRTKTDKVERRELIVLITPRIVGEPMMGDEGDAAAHAYVTRHETVVDKMTPIGRRHWSTHYLRLAQAAWAAGDGQAALKNVNLAIHFEPTRAEANALRKEIVDAGFGDKKVRSHLREGLAPGAHPHKDYSKQGFPWQKPGDSYNGGPPIETAHDDGQPGSARDIAAPPREIFEAP
jgi:type IV pilus assembly protein PilQ